MNLGGLGIPVLIQQPRRPLVHAQNDGLCKLASRSSRRARLKQTMAITLDLSPAVEARLIQQAQKQGVSVSRYIETLLENPTEGPIPNETVDRSPYVERLRPVLKKFDELPRLAPIQAAAESIGFDDAGLRVRWPKRQPAESATHRFLKPASFCTARWDRTARVSSMNSFPSPMLKSSRSFPPNPGWRSRPIDSSEKERAIRPS
jgi:hypothetical protein